MVACRWLVRGEPREIPPTAHPKRWESTTCSSSSATTSSSRCNVHAMLAEDMHGQLVPWCGEPYTPTSLAYGSALRHMCHGLAVGAGATTYHGHVRSRSMWISYSWWWSRRARSSSPYCYVPRLLSLGDREPRRYSVPSYPRKDILLLAAATPVAAAVAVCASTPAPCSTQY